MLLGVLMASCSKTNTPEFVVEKFVIAMEQANYEEAKKYCDSKTAQLVDMLAGIAISEKEKENAKKQAPKVTITKVEEYKEDKNKVRVFYKQTSADGQEIEKNIDAVKIDGKWKASIQKENKERDCGHQHGDPNCNHDHENDTIIEDENSIEEQGVEIQPAN